ncbi:MAG: MASE1 domain-containing protein [Steroidobacteraceae bacterium]
MIAQRRPPPTERLVVGLFAISATILCAPRCVPGLLCSSSSSRSSPLSCPCGRPLLGALVAAPLIITLGFNVQGFTGQSDGGRLELFATVAAAIAVTVATFAQPALQNGMSVHYGLFPVLLWLAVRYRPRTTFLVASGVALLVAMLHVRGGGPFTSPGNALADRTLGVQIFLGMLLIATTVLTVSRHEYRLLQEKLQESTRRLYSAEDAGRRAVAIHLHDGIGQTLIALGLEVTQVRRSGGIGDALAPELDECNRLIGLAHRATRRLLAELQPPGLVDLGLVAAIEGLIDRIRQRGRLQIELHCSGHVDPMSMQRRLLLYRCARELLANVAQHARADRASVDLCATDEQLELIVRDQGTGWDPQLWQRNYLSGKSGLFGLKDQIELLGGRMHVDAAPGQGCSVQIVLPRESG